MKLSLFLELCFLPFECSPILRMPICLWIQVHPLVDSRVEDDSVVDLDSHPSSRSLLVDSSLCSLYARVVLLSLSLYMILSLTSLFNFSFDSSFIFNIFKSL